MRFRLQNLFSALFDSFFWVSAALCVFKASVAGATLTVTPESPYSLSAASVVNYAGYRTSAVIPNGFVDTSDGFKFVDLSSVSTSTTDHLLLFDVQSNRSFGNLTTGQDVVVMVTATVSGVQVPIPISYAGEAFCTAFGNTRCQAFVNSKYYAAKYSVAAGNKTLRIGFFARDLCESPLTAGIISGCTSGVVDEPSTTTLTRLGVRFYVSLEDTSNATSPELGRIADSEENRALTLEFQKVAPSITCPTNLSSVYTPGDGQISFNAGAITTSHQAGIGSSVASLIFLAKKDPATPPSTGVDDTYANDSALIVARISSGNTTTIEGFENTTNGNDHLYNSSIGVRDRAGVVNDDFCTGSGSTYQIQTAEIFGLLRQSQCFIATAAFRSAKGPEVTLLRRFRDEFLLSHRWGRTFVSFYYKHSPQAAEWLLKNPEWRGFTLRALILIQVWAWLVLNPWSLLALGLVFLLGRRAPVVALALFCWAIPVQAEESFIKEIQEQIGQKTETSGSPVSPLSPEPYIARKKKELERSGKGPGEDYSLIEEIRSTQPESSSTESQSFIEKARSEIKSKQSEGLISDFKKEESLTPGARSSSGPRAIKSEKAGHAFGFKAWTAGSRSVTGDSSAFYTSYESLYGSGYTPDFRFFYEDQVLQSEWFISLGWFTEVGFGVKRASGSYAFAPKKPGGGTFGTASDVRFTFVTVPVSVGGIARFNLPRLFRPQVKVAPVAVGYFEDRSDSKSLKRGYSTGILMEAGVAFQIDWFDSRSSWSLYETFQIKQHFLTFDYQRLSANSGDVDFSFQGLTLGLLFEI
jgi:hypothetical protein